MTTLKNIIESRDIVVEALNQALRQLDAYEYSPESLEFIADPHQIAMDEGLSDDEVNDIWDEIAASLQLTPDWCLEARISYTLSLGDHRFHTFTQLLPRLSGLHKEKFKVVAIAKTPANQVDKYLDLAES
jgi:hypothetical protein